MLDLLWIGAKINNLWKCLIAPMKEMTNAIFWHQNVMFPYLYTRGYISKMSGSVSSGFQTRETFETTRPQAAWFVFYPPVQTIDHC